MRNKPTVDDVQLLVSKMIIKEQDEWTLLLNQIYAMDPAGNYEKLEAIHNSRIKLLEQIFKAIKDMKAKG